MHIEIKRANRRKEGAALASLDKKIFPPSDCFDEDTWRRFECYWLIVDGEKVGSIGMLLHRDPDNAKYVTPGKRYLTITTTGILPEYQDKGLGTFCKKWQIEYARERGFERIITFARVSNTRIINLNKKFGFREIRISPNYYPDPIEDAIVMELEL